MSWDISSYILENKRKLSIKMICLFVILVIAQYYVKHSIVESRLNLKDRVYTDLEINFLHFGNYFLFSFSYYLFSSLSAIRLLFLHRRQKKFFFT